VRDDNRITGTLRIELVGEGGAVLLTRRARNTVVRTGAELVGALFSGGVTTPVNGMAVGTNAQPMAAPYELAGLTTVDESGQPLSGATAVAIAPADVKVETLADEQRVLVSVRAVLPKEAALSHDQSAAFLGEAALGVLATDGSNKLAKIYNRVVFDPIPKGKEHELALYWEISFPYGA
jgi:hypothetical protein